jgi:cytochrome P450
VQDTLITYDPLTPGFFADPYPHYAQLRAENPVHKTRFGFWILTRYEDVVAGYLNPALSREMMRWEHFTTWRRGPADGPLERMMANWLVMIDPPRHTPLRAIHDRVFGNKLLDSAGMAIDQIVDTLLKPALADGGFDLVADFADRIPVYLINHLLGLPPADWDQFVGWSRAIALTSEPQLTTKVLAAGRSAQQAMYDYFRPIAAQRRQFPEDDVLSGLAVTEIDGRPMDDGELLDSIIFLYQAGHPTSTQLIALAVRSLLDNPDELARLRADRSLLGGAVEELQRYDGPVQMNDRIAVADMTLGGFGIAEGELVRLCLASANRDDERYPGAARLDIGRGAGGQLGYGHGLHYCVGAALGRMAAAAAIGALLDNAPGLRQADGRVRFLPSTSNRGLMAFPVEF